MIETTRSEVSLDLLLGAQADRSLEGAGARATLAPDHGQAYGTWTIERADPVTRADLERFARGLGEDIYWAKGFAYLREDTDHRYVYQEVGTRWSLEAGRAWSEDSRRTAVVLIGSARAAGTRGLDALRPSPA